MEDRRALCDFFDRLSPESRRRRFSSLSAPHPDLIASMCESSNPVAGLTLLATRHHNNESRIIAIGSYIARNATTAEVAFAVDDAHHGKGLGTLLLEWLALRRCGTASPIFGVTQSDNQAMLDVFRESGFAVEEKPDRGEVEVDLSIVPSETSMARLNMRHRVATVAGLRPFFRPRSVAVIGASRDRAAIGHRLLEAIVGGGFLGTVYPVNPKAKEIRGLRAYPSVRDLPFAVDLAIIAVPPTAVLGVVDDCAVRGIRTMVLITAGFAEVGGAGHELQNLLMEKVPRIRHAAHRPQLPGVSSDRSRNSAQRHLSLDFPRRDVWRCPPIAGRWASPSLRWPPAMAWAFPVASVSATGRCVQQ